MRLVFTKQWKILSEVIKIADTFETLASLAVTPHISAFLWTENFEFREAIRIVIMLSEFQLAAISSPVNKKAHEARFQTCCLIF